MLKAQKIKSHFSSKQKIKKIPHHLQRITNAGFLLTRAEKIQQMTEQDNSDELEEFDEEIEHDENIFKLRSICRLVSLYKWRRLQQIFVINGSSKIGDKELETLGSEISKHFPQLRELSIHFKVNYDYDLHGSADPDRTHHITDYGIQNFIPKIARNLSLLQKLNLKFQECNGITSLGLKTLALEISRFLPHLKQLSLNFTGCQGIKDEGIKILSSEIAKHLPHLKLLSLSFHLCNALTDDAIELLARKLPKNLSMLENLSLDFGRCSDLTDESLKILCSEIGKHLTNLKVLWIIFDLTEATHEEKELIQVELPKQFPHRKLRFDLF